MAYTLAEAAKAAGRGKTTLLRMIRSGRLSASRDPLTGGWMVEPAELHRLYPPAHHDSVHQPDSGAPRIAALEARLEAADDAIRVRDDMLAAHQSTIDDLRRRLDTATGQLGEALSQVRVLTDQRPTPLATPRRSWWPWRRE
jgi:uncharacterized coiled-coil protein SlyX